MNAGPDAMITAAIQRNWHRPSVNDWVAVLARLPLFADVGRRRLRKVAELAEFRDYEPHSVVVQTGDTADGFYVILAGRAKRAGRAGGRLLQPGDYFGEMALLDGGARSATIVAVSELQTMRLPRAPFLKLLEREPQIAIGMLGGLAGRVRGLERPTVA
ncbi:MAG TPA: cyclic nucleotide-binding domain-containing protein [Gaiellaceae bacterium]|nr:cyclic nucleotide-binding domain-containing protein [Gaiellaceae bacterium]